MRFFVVVVFLAFAVLAGCSSCNRESAGIQVDRQLAAHVPADASVVFGADIEKLKAAPFYQRHASAARVPMLDAVSQRLGVDPRRDLASVIVYLTPGQQQPVALLRGSFSNRALAARLQALGADPLGANPNLLQTGGEAVLFTAPGMLAFGPPSALANTSGPRGLAPAISARLATLPKAGQLWLVSSEGLRNLRLPVDSNLGSALGVVAADITAATAGLRLDDGVHLQADLSCVSPKGAEQVRDALRGFVALGRLTTRSGEQDLLRVYDAIHVENENASVHVRADLSADLSDRALALVTRLQPLQQPPLQR